MVNQAFRIKIAHRSEKKKKKKKENTRDRSVPDGSDKYFQFSKLFKDDMSASKFLFRSRCDAGSRGRSAWDSQK